MLGWSDVALNQQVPGSPANRLLLPPFHPILNAVVILYFITQLQVLVASLPVYPDSYSSGKCWERRRFLPGLFGAGKSRRKLLARMVASGEPSGQ